MELVNEATEIFPSTGALRTTIKGGGVSSNKEKIQAEEIYVDADRLLNDRYILVQKGKKNYYLVVMR